MQSRSLVLINLYEKTGIEAADSPLPLARGCPVTPLWCLCEEPLAKQILELKKSTNEMKTHNEN